MRLGRCFVGTIQAIIMGSVIGIVGALPPAFLFELALKKDKRVNVAVGLASILISFIMLSIAVFVICLAARELVLPFGVAEATSFLLIWAVEAWRAWRDAQSGASPRERNRGESTGESTRRD
jgi:hypothetical protein